MKIKYDFTSNYFKYQNEAGGIVFKRNKLKKNPDTKTTGFIGSLTKIFALSFLFFFIAAIFFYKIDIITNILVELLSAIIFVYVGIIILFSLNITLMKTKNIKGTIELNKDELIDKVDDGLSIGVIYEKIDLIVITNRITVIITKLPVLIVFSNENLNKRKFIDSIKKINADIKVVDKTDK